MQIRAVLFFGGIPLPEQVDKIHAALMDDPDFRIGRPRQLYTGPEKRDYVAVDKRK